MNNAIPLDLTHAVGDELTALKSVRRHITQKVLAEELGVSTRQVIRMMQGEADIKIPQLETFARLFETDVLTVLRAAYKRMS
jgi:transcriptional regulator with XRE-family HTH domain